MPFGGITNSQGLQVQPVVPGISQVGNIHISGVALADTAMAALWAPAGSTLALQNKFLRYGYNQTIGAWTYVNQNSNYTMIGNAQTASINPNGNQQTGAVMIGYATAAHQGGGVTIGDSAVNGSTTVYPSSSAYNVVIGTQAAARHVGGNGAASVVIGHASAESVVPADANTLLGRGITVSTGGANLGVGRNHTFGASSNNIVLGMTAQIPPGSNGISIGDSSHTGDLTFAGSAYYGFKRRNVADTNSAFTNAEQMLAYTSITAARVATLPAANSVKAGRAFIVIDESGNASAVNTITLTASGGDTINGAATVAIANAYGVKEVVSDGVSKWTVLRSL